LALVLALAAIFWVFFDSQRRGVDATLWKVIAVVSVILIIPSVILAIQVLTRSSLFPGLVQAATPLAWLGIIGGLAALVTLFAYSLGLGVGASAHVCPTCGQVLDSSWDRCPYCEPSSIPAAVAPEFSAPPPPPAQQPPIVETYPIPEPGPVNQVAELEMPGAAKTEFMVRVLPQLAWLIQLSGIRTGKDFRLGEVTNIGREASQNDIVVEDQKVGRQHARIRLVDDDFVLHDLASLNKTYVNGEEILKQVLTDGDKIRFADVEFFFMQIETPES
jgi:hypothetical protein